MTDDEKIKILAKAILYLAKNTNVAWETEWDFKQQKWTGLKMVDFENELNEIIKE